MRNTNQLRNLVIYTTVKMVMLGATYCLIKKTLEETAKRLPEE
jgi:hypothetical protein